MYSEKEEVVWIINSFRKEIKMKVSVIGGGAWGITLAQALSDNDHQVLVRDVNEMCIEKINKLHIHHAFASTIPFSIKGTLDLKEAVDFADVLLLCVPTKVMRSVLQEINNLIDKPKLFINVSKGIEPETSYCVSQIVDEVIDKNKCLGYVILSGPSHAEEMIQRKITSLVAASNNRDNALFVQKLFSNDLYLRVYTSTDVIGVETGGSVKNAIAIVSGIATGMGLGENARAFLISRGIREIIMIVEALGGKKETAYGLSGIGDLIVTASSMNSRNFQCGLKIGQGMSVKDALASMKQTVEGIKTIEAAYEIGLKYKLDLPIINSAYLVIKENYDVTTALSKIMSRSLKDENIL